MAQTGMTVDLSNCDREPIHVPGAIQPHGCLVVCGLPDMIVEHVSENIADCLGKGPSDVLGRTLAQVFADAAVHAFRSGAQRAMSAGMADRLFGLRLPNGKVVDASIHVAGYKAYLEIEPGTAAGHDAHRDPLADMHAAMSQLGAVTSMEALARIVALYVRATTGYDRVMVYRFLPDGAGQVIAEARRSDLVPYLHLRYPASDIPKQARELYKRRLLRIIADVGYEAVPVVPATTADGQPLDLGMTNLRSVSPIHIEYLRNMGVGATLTISLLNQGELWGLIACHHMGPRLIGERQRASLELYARLVSLLIESKERDLALEAEESARRVHDRFVVGLSPERSVFDNLTAFGEDLLEMIPADGLAVVADGRVWVYGQTPDPEELPAIARFLNTYGPRVYATHELSSFLGSATAYRETASGVLSIPISRVPRDYLVFFRREVLQSVTWAGDPTKPAQIGPNGPRLMPRSSFEAWKETVRGQSRPWSLVERRAAEMLRVSLIEVVLRQQSLAEEERKAAAERQRLLIGELNHRIKNTLALMRSLVAHGGGASMSLDQYVRDIRGRIEAVARAHDQALGSDGERVGVGRLVDTALEAWRLQRPEAVEAKGPPVVLDARAHQAVALTLHELATNAAKHGALSNGRGRIQVAWSREESGALLITWRERGGPAVQAPREGGFGSTVIRSVIPHNVGGEVDVDFAMEGVTVRIRLPAELATDAETLPPKPPETSGPEGPVVGSVLIVEDNFVVALELESMAQRLGVERIALAPTLRDARTELDGASFDLVLLDINLGAETSIGLAEELIAAGQPMVLTTGYGEHALLPASLSGVPILDKPYVEASVSAKLRMGARHAAA